MEWKSQLNFGISCLHTLVPSSGKAIHGFSLRMRQSLYTLLPNLNFRIVYLLVDSWRNKVKEKRKKKLVRSGKRKSRKGERGRRCRRRRGQREEDE